MVSSILLDFLLTELTYEIPTTQSADVEFPLVSEFCRLVNLDL
jgi:hypothetical protein